MGCTKGQNDVEDVDLENEVKLPKPQTKSQRAINVITIEASDGQSPEDNAVEKYFSLKHHHSELKDVTTIPTNDCHYNINNNDH